MEGTLGEGGQTNIAERVRQFIVRQLKEDAHKVVDEASFTDNLGVDSLDLIELVLALETEFALEIPDSAVETIDTVGDLIQYIQKTLEK